MAKADVLDILMAKRMNPLEFQFENLWIPPMNYYLSQQDIDELRKIATSARLSSKINEKYKMIDNIMRARGFKRFSAGTNRVVYSCLEDTRFLVKIAVDKVGMQDNPLEYENQFLLKPYVTKMFYISPCGTVGFAERVLPIKNKAEFKEIASDVFDILINKILGRYVVEDVGTKYFMNWGIRMGFGPVLLDYPYVYKLDGKKLYCTKKNLSTGQLCDGEIDYDQGFNHLVCTRCGKVYMAVNLRDNSIDNRIIIKGGIQMRVILKKGDEIVSTPIPTDDIMTNVEKKPINKVSKLVVRTNMDINYDEHKDDIVKEDIETECESVNVSVEQTEESANITPRYEETDQVDHHDNNTADEIENDDNNSDTESVTSNQMSDDSTNTSVVESIETSEVCAKNEKTAECKPLRDNKGRFISSKGKKTSNNNKRSSSIKSSFIPSEY